MQNHVESYATLNMLHIKLLMVKRNGKLCQNSTLKTNFTSVNQKLLYIQKCISRKTKVNKCEKNLYNNANVMYTPKINVGLFFPPNVRYFCTGCPLRIAMDEALWCEGLLLDNSGMQP